MLSNSRSKPFWTNLQKAAFVNIAVEKALEANVPKEFGAVFFWKEVFAEAARKVSQLLLENIKIFFVVFYLIGKVAVGKRFVSRLLWTGCIWTECWRWFRRRIGWLGLCHRLRHPWRRSRVIQVLDDHVKPEVGLNYFITWVNLEVAMQ